MFTIHKVGGICVECLPGWSAQLLTFSFSFSFGKCFAIALDLANVFFRHGIQPPFDVPRTNGFRTPSRSAQCRPRSRRTRALLRTHSPRHQWFVTHYPPCSRHQYTCLIPNIVLSKGSVTDLPAKGPDGNDVYRTTSAPAHVVIGSAGAMQEESWMEPQPEWSAVRYANGAGHFYTDTFGYGSLRVSQYSDVSRGYAILFIFVHRVIVSKTGP